MWYKLGLCVLLVCWVTVVDGTSLRDVQASPSADAEEVCWPEITIPMKRLVQTIRALPPSSRLWTLLQSSGLSFQQLLGQIPYTMLCALDEVNSVADLIRLIHYPDPETFQYQYRVYSMMYAFMGGKNTIVSVFQPLENFMQWSVDHDFPSYPFNGTTEEELASALTELYNGFKPVVQIMGLTLPNVDVYMRQVAHAFVVSHSVQDLMRTLDLSPTMVTTLHQWSYLKPDFPVIYQLLAFVRVAIEEFDKHGLFTLPPA